MFNTLDKQCSQYACKSVGLRQKKRPNQGGKDNEFSGIAYVVLPARDRREERRKGSRYSAGEGAYGPGGYNEAEKKWRGGRWGEVDIASKKAFAGSYIER